MIKAIGFLQQQMTHKVLVKKFGGILINDCSIRIDKHDNSKLTDPELSLFNKYSPKLNTLTYGSEEYHQNLELLKPAIQHHYTNNRHHPEYHKNGIKDMNLVDILEMLCDWLAATKRHNDGDIYKSLQINAKRFGISEDLLSILTNTIRDYFANE